MRAYSQSYWEVLSLPVKTFWSLNRQVNRLRAEEELRQLKLQTASQSGEGYAALHAELVREIGNPSVVEKGLDEDKFLELQEMFGQGRTVSETHKVE